MVPLTGLVVLLCLHCGPVCSVQMLTLEVSYGGSAILPCDGSAYLEEEGGVRWEAMGEEVASVRGGEQTQGDNFKGRVQFPSEERLREGDWSVVLQPARLSDTDVYECIWQGRRTVSTVWLTVVAHTERSLVVRSGDTVDLTCYIDVSRSQSPNDVQVWFTKNGVSTVSTEKEPSLSDSTEEFHLHIISAKMSDNGEYRCLYRTRDSDEPRPGTPETITLTVLDTNPTTDTGDPLFNPDETTTAAGRPVMFWTEEATVSHLIPVHLEESTQPAEGAPSESLQRDTVPWIRIGLISGVLLVTMGVLCVLKALQKV